MTPTITPARRTLLSVLLAGGESRRFGSVKALALYRGMPLWERARASLEPLGFPVVALVNDPKLAEKLPLESRPDREQGQGPLMGLATGLEWAQEGGFEGIAMLACDMPWVGPRVLPALNQHWDGSRIVVPASRTWMGFEPLCGLYPTSVLESLNSAIGNGVRSVGEFVSAQNPLVVAIEVGGRTFLNANEPADLRPPIVAVVGNKNSGKTTLSVALIQALSQRGHIVMSVKHGHHFRLDTEGTDSWKHRHVGGAERVILAGPDEFAVMGAWGVEGPLALEALVERHFMDADIVIAEGFRGSAVPKIEIYRSSVQSEAALGPDVVGHDVVAVVTDRQDLNWPGPVFSPEDEELGSRIATIVEERFL